MDQRVLLAAVGAWPAVAVIGVAAVAALIVVAAVPKRQVSKWADQDMTAKERADLENAARTTIVQIVGGIAILATFAITVIQISDARRASDRTLQLTQQGQVTERFTSAIQELDAKEPSGGPALELRLGAIFALDRVGLDSARERHAVSRILLAYVRVNAPVRPVETAGLIACTDRTTDLRDDLQAAVGVVLNFPRGNIVILPRVGLSGLRANGKGPGRRMEFLAGDLRGSQLISAHLQWADLDDARLQNADLRAACLLHAHLADARLDHADLRVADLNGANLDRTHLEGADLSTVRHLTHRQISAAHIDACTLLPWRPTQSRHCKVRGQT